MMNAPLRRSRPYIFWGQTQSLCEVCLALVPTKIQILVYSVILVATSLVPGLIGFMGLLYMVVAVVTGLVFLWLALRLFRTTDDKTMRKAGRSLFAYSLSYLFVIFLALLTDRVAGMLGWL